MKKLILIVASSLIGVASFAQEGFHIGLKGGGLGSYLYNTDLSNTDKDYIESRQKFNSSFAITTNYHFSETVGLGVDLNFANVSQDYIYYSSGNIDATLNAKYMRIPLLVHFNTDPNSSVMFKGFFGPQLSLLNGATLTSTYVAGSGERDPLVVTDDNNVDYTYFDRANLGNTYLNPTFGDYNGSQDVKARMEGTTIGALLGLGMAINLTDYLNVELGATLGYEFTDAGSPFKYSDVANTESDFLYDVGAPTAAPTNIINAGFNLGINYIIN